MRCDWRKYGWRDFEKTVGMTLKKLTLEIKQKLHRRELRRHKRVRDLWKH